MSLASDRQAVKKLAPMIEALQSVISLADRLSVLESLEEGYPKKMESLEARIAESNKMQESAQEALSNARNEAAAIIERANEAAARVKDTALSDAKAISDASKVSARDAKAAADLAQKKFAAQKQADEATIIDLQNKIAHSEAKLQEVRDAIAAITKV